jgi:hypothetical protein
MTIVRLACRVERLELERKRDRRRPLSHEEALAWLDAHPEAFRDEPALTDEELDEAWNRLRAERAAWGDAP